MPFYIFNNPIRHDLPATYSVLLLRTSNLVDFLDQKKGWLFEANPITEKSSLSK